MADNRDEESDSPADPGGSQGNEGQQSGQKFPGDRDRAANVTSPGRAGLSRAASSEAARLVRGRAAAASRTASHHRTGRGFPIRPTLILDLRTVTTDLHITNVAGCTGEPSVRLVRP